MPAKAATPHIYLPLQRLQRAEREVTPRAPAATVAVVEGATARVQAATALEFLDSLPAAPPLTGSGFSIGAAPTR